MVFLVLPCLTVNYHIPYTTSQYTSYYGFSNITMWFGKLSHPKHHSQNKPYYGRSSITMPFSNLSHPVHHSLIQVQQWSCLSVNYHIPYASSQYYIHIISTEFTPIHTFHIIRQMYLSLSHLTFPYFEYSLLPYLSHSYFTSTHQATIFSPLF